MIALLIPLLSLWLCMAALLIDGFAIPFAQIKAEHLSADCINQASLAGDAAIAADSDEARGCAKHLKPVVSLFAAEGSVQAQAYSLEVPASTRCGLAMALCKLPKQRAESISASDYRAIRYENNHCELTGQKAWLLAEPSVHSASAQIGLVPLIDCEQPSPILIDLADWHCADYEQGLLRWWGAASRLLSPCLVSASQLAQGIDIAKPSLGRSLRLRQS